MACVFKARINPQFNRVGKPKGVAGFKKQTELYPYKHQRKSTTSLTFSFNRLSNSNVKVLTIYYNYHRVKKGVSVFRKGSGKSNLNVSGTFPQGGYDVKREREK